MGVSVFTVNYFISVDKELNTATNKSNLLITKCMFIGVIKRCAYFVRNRDLL